MLRDETVICISSIDWDFNWQGHQEIMSTFAQQGNRVLYIENTGIHIPHWKDLPRLAKRISNWKRHVGGIRQVKDRLWVCSPVILPFPYSRLAGRINRLLLYRTIRAWTHLVGSKASVFWTFLPTRISLDLLDVLEPELVVYYCIADFEALGPARKVRRTERELLKRADVVFAQGELLAERCRRVHKKEVSIFPFGVRSELFDREEPTEIPSDLAPIPSPRIGYVGGLHRHVDLDLIQTLARRHPDWSLVLVGPPQESQGEFRSEGNIFWLGARPHEEIPSYVAGFDVCLIPYRLNRYTQTVYPTKLHEYLMLGKPVVSTALPEVVQFNHASSLVHIGDSPDGFESCILKALHEKDPCLTNQRKQAARLHSWATRIEAMSEVLRRNLEFRRFEISSHWNALLLRTLRQARRRVLSWGAVLLCSYGLIFHTPFLWWVAEPLKLQSPLRPADAVVVFAGGVGESGQAGQGYGERVTHAVGLYRQGLAPRLIFSSGYRYALDETDLMKSLAVSLGVPEGDILLERKAGNTRENVVFSAAILRRESFHSALVISSPYHMRRVALVWRKEAPDIEALWAPIPYSHFFGNQKRIYLRHLVAILHEYLGIFSYYLKGWV